MNKPLCLLLSAVFLLLIACQKDQNKEVSEGSVFNTKASGETGLTFANQLDENSSLNIIEYLYYYNGAGVGVGDIDNDGLEDIYFAANELPDKLYLNKGNLKFEDISKRAGLKTDPSWSNGVSMDDLNGDGYLDIYVCKVGVGQPNVHNELYINKGDGTFEEKSSEYGLDFSGYSTQACFFDYDRDGDLDMYLLNHAVHSVRSYGNTKKRQLKDSLSGDRFYENRLAEEGKFVEVTDAAGIYSSPLGYGLAVSCGDLNNDGWVDIYVGNDFHENDYLYLNNGDKTFTESVAGAFSHTSQFSMGVDIADLNNDGWADIFTTDMLPFSAEIALQSGGEDTDQIKRIKDDLGFELQYARNHFQLNQQNGTFSDIGYLTGTFATDWSWSVLLQDFDNNSLNDIFISNGIVRRPNDLDYINFLNAYDQSGASDAERSAKLIENMPSQPLSNMLFFQKKKGQFTDLKDASFGQPSFSTGAAYADFDKDGDLDLVTNNINREAFLLENTTSPNGNYLSLIFEGNDQFPLTKGTKAYLYTNGMLLTKELQTTRGFLSSSTHALHFGLGQNQKIDSLRIIWPDQYTQTLSNISPNQELLIQRPAMDQLAQFSYSPKARAEESYLVFPFKHQENQFFDEDQEKLIPQRLSQEGPAILYEDLTGDGLMDIYVGGGRGQEARLYIGQANGSYSNQKTPDFASDAKYEDVDAATLDFDGDGDKDIYVVSGGNDYRELNKLLEDRLYLNNGNGVFKRIPISLPHTNGNVVSVGDFDQDGYEDIFVGARSIPGSYGLSPYSFLLKNLKGQGVDVAYKVRMGMVTDGHLVDMDNDQDLDLIVCGDWMNVKFYENVDGKLENKTKDYGLGESFGLWNALAFTDLNEDGRLDILAGNAGLNHKWQATDSLPLKLYVGDFDKNGYADPIIFYNYFGRYMPFASLDKLQSQMSIFKKKYNTYKSFNQVQTIYDLIENADSLIAEEKWVNELRSMIFLSGTRGYEAVPLGIEEQYSDIQDFEIGKEGQVYYVGNSHEYVAELGNATSNTGRVLKGFDPQTKTFTVSQKLPLPHTLNARIVRLMVDGKLLVFGNNDYAYVLSIPQ
jgi:hypothetical protein